MKSESKIRSEQKRVRISSKRQFTIPQKFFIELGFDREAICMAEDGKLIVIPAGIGSGGELAEQILTELVAEGYSGNELLTEFKRRQAKVGAAAGCVSKETKEAGEEPGSE